MTISLYDTSVPALIRGLTCLSHILTIAETHATENKIPESEIMEAKLAPNMYPFAFQIWTACNSAKHVLVRVAGTEPIPVADDQKSFATLQDRIQNTLAILEGVDRTAFEGAEGREVVVTVREREMRFTGLSYLTTFAVPNFYFHVSMAYALLRMRGVPVGKMDYLNGGHAF